MPTVKPVCAATSNMHLAKSFFSRSRGVNQTPCTNTEDHLCHIFRDISLWNEYFWQLDLELRELLPGQLSLVKKHEAYVGAYAYNQIAPNQIEAATTLLHHLLTCHHCVNSVVIDAYILPYHHQLICDALCKSISLTKLTLYGLRVDTPRQREFAKALLHLNQLRELEFLNVTFTRSFIDGLSELLASTLSLKTLTVARENFDCVEDAVAFVQALGRNQSITTLSCDITLLRAQPLDRRTGMSLSDRYATVVADYLYGNKTLRTLNVRGDYRKRFTAVARPIVMALVKNDTLTNLSLIRLSLGDEDLGLITWLLRHNRTLTSFNMTTCECCEVSIRGYCSLAALNDNRVLGELTLNLSRLDTSDCRSLFRVLASKPSLKKVTIQRFNDVDAAEICRAARETDTQARFFIGKHCVLHNTVEALTTYKELSNIVVMSRSFDRYELFLNTLSPLPSCAHVTSLCLDLRLAYFTDRASSLIAKCITDMTALRNLEVGVNATSSDYTSNEARRVLAQALSVNKSIRRLRVYDSWFRETESEILAGAFQSSRSLCQLYFLSHDYRCVNLLMRKLSPNFSSNYTLLDMRLERPSRYGFHWFPVAEVIRRNRSLVVRAAHFVDGKRLKYCAEAVELVHSTPGLVEKVQELACVDENEAALRIKKSLKSFSELNDFMRLAGVVKYGVTCHSRDDGQKQLVDIGRDCWLIIREYLKIGDILDEQ